MFSNEEKGGNLSCHCLAEAMLFMTTQRVFEVIHLDMLLIIKVPRFNEIHLSARDVSSFPTIENKLQKFIFTEFEGHQQFGF